MYHNIQDHNIDKKILIFLRVCKIWWVYYPTKANRQTKLTIWNPGASDAPTHSPTRCCSVALARQLFVRCSVRRSVRPLVGCVRQTRESTGRPELSGSESYGKLP